MTHQPPPIRHHDQNRCSFLTPLVLRAKCRLAPRACVGGQSSKGASSHYYLGVAEMKGVGGVSCCLDVSLHAVAICIMIMTERFGLIDRFLRTCRLYEFGEPIHQKGLASWPSLGP
ncbi:hypothetical protein AM571_CH01722 [Rhizobium etli 8C-3]|uniref:Uncharacterized protein n=1 Tax=Rhizobium etli 8C-3 TaxID=538025 RepID=A0A1L5P343_RHIET|nr:hypothetical protein AM571_CH01722 [Rhizobium etli 8C-3]